MNLFLLFLAIPLLWRVATPFIPDEYLDPYAYWDTVSLNRQTPDGFVNIEWRNLGYWDVSRPNSGQRALADTPVPQHDLHGCQ